MIRDKEVHLPRQATHTIIANSFLLLGTETLTLLGRKELIKWVSLVALKGLSCDEPGELILKSLIRGRFAQNLALSKMAKAQVSNAFLMGIFSHIDALLDRPLPEILHEISLDEEIKQTLLGKGHNQLSTLYQLIQSYERGDWEVYSFYVDEIKSNERDISKSYREALLWAHELVLCNDYYNNAIL